MIHRRFINIACVATCLMWLGGTRSATATTVAIPQTPDQPVGRLILLPLFPLDMVVFPGQSVLLHIFEPRYRELIGDCVRDGITFGISPLLSHGLANYGTEVELAGVLRTDESATWTLRLKECAFSDCMSFAVTSPVSFIQAAWYVSKPTTPRTGQPSSTGWYLNSTAGETGLAPRRC